MGDNPYQSPSAVQEPKPPQPKSRKRLTVLEVYIVLTIVALQIAVLLPAVNQARISPRNSQPKPVILEGSPFDPEAGWSPWSYILLFLLPFTLLSPLVTMAIVFVVRRPLRQRFPGLLPLTRAREQESTGQSRLTVVLEMLLCPAAVIVFVGLLLLVANIFYE